MASTHNGDIMNELRSLQAQVMHFKDLLAEEGERVSGEVRGRTASALNGASRKAQDVATYARDEAGTMASVVREHPAATSTALLAVGVIGGLVGYFLANASQPSRNNSHWNWR
ncbi:hypothetical protein J5N58_17600 [Rhizobium cremeum]|uniref:hypothetical protein n=1 Tax=Rhizobium cremeum TaxID=2813827 RepID=UPI000DD57B27|nr:hypothetical protein [Rhizobium cremeum]MCJ7996237.1 hypothetical protein [Rhizobium cremeum]MCJ8001496.1 hypothetical protein [Rhizobium cremeum]